MATTSQPVPSASTETAYPEVPQYTASGRPSTWSDRTAFRLWIAFFTLALLFAAVNYLMSKLSDYFH